MYSGIASEKLCLLYPQWPVSLLSLLLPLLTLLQFFRLFSVTWLLWPRDRLAVDLTVDKMEVDFVANVYEA